MPVDSPNSSRDDFAEAFGEPIRRVLDLNTWSQGADMAALYPKLRQIIAEGVAQERRVRNPIRDQLFPQLRPGVNATAPKAVGVYQMDETQIEEVHRGLLFNGVPECCDGTILAHNSLVLSVVQIGVGLVAYQGAMGTWVHRLYRRDMYAQMSDPVEEAMALLKKRGEREAENAEAPRDPIARIVRRAMMDWAERAALCRLSTALWRMGHGNPISYNLLMPTTDELVADSIEVMQQLILDHKRFVFVASEPADRLLETIGDALRPLEFAVVDTLEIFDLNEAQEERFQKALDVTVRALDNLNVWTDDDRRFVKEGLDEFDGGYPKMRLSHLYDIVRATADTLDSAGKNQSTNMILKSSEFQGKSAQLAQLIDTSVKSVPSWRKLQGKVGRIERLNLFDSRTAYPLKYADMLEPGRVSIIDLSDSDSTLVNNLIISDLLRGVQKAQDAAYQDAMALGRDPTPAVVIIEEAHEFLSAQRIGKMPILHQQVERIAKRGRKRWLGLVFVTQLPQHLPDAILGLVNNYILHKVGDANVIARLKRSVGGLDDALWARLPRLAPGQAVVSLASLARPMLTAMDPAPCKLRMVR